MEKQLYHIIRTARRDNVFSTSVRTFTSGEKTEEELFLDACRDTLECQNSGWEYRKPMPGMEEYTSTGVGNSCEDFTHLALAESRADLTDGGQDSAGKSAAFKSLLKAFGGNEGICEGFERLLLECAPDWPVSLREDIEGYGGYCTDLSEQADRDDFSHAAFYNAYDFLKNGGHGSAAIDSAVNAAVRGYFLALLEDSRHERRQ